MIPELTFRSVEDTEEIRAIICDAIPQKALSAGILSFLLFGLLVCIPPPLPSPPPVYFARTSSSLMMNVYHPILSYPNTVFVLSIIYKYIYELFE